MTKLYTTADVEAAFMFGKSNHSWSTFAEWFKFNHSEEPVESPDDPTETKSYDCHGMYNEPPVDLTDGATRQSDQYDFGSPPEDGINHKNGLSKVYHGGHTYYPYNGNLMHDSDCICFKRAENDETPDSEDLV